MSGMYAMRRANGDWFAFEEHGNLRVPVFGSSHAAMQARALNELAPTSGETGVRFWLANGSSTRLSHGQSMNHAQLALHMHEPAGQL